MMSAKHRLSESPRRQHMGQSGGAIRTAWSIVFGSVIAAAAVAALLVNVVGSPHSPPALPDQQVSQEGTLIAVSAGSVTARSRDGVTRTYLVTPQTAVITKAGSQFTVNDEVAIIGTIQNGTALATAVAHRDLGHGAGPPMDCIAGRTVSDAPGDD